MYYKKLYFYIDLIFLHTDVCVRAGARVNLKLTYVL